MSVADQVKSTQELNITGFNEVPDAGVVIEFLYKGATIQVSANQLPYRIGRDDKENDLYIPAIVASRHHCIVCIEDGRLGVTDTSRNGTFVQIGQTSEIKVHNEFFPLLGKGMMKVGEPIGSGEINTIYFKCC